jgi:hypothetical protein
VGGVEAQRALEESRDGGRLRVGVDLGVAEPGVVVDDRVHDVDAVLVPAVLACDALALTLLVREKWLARYPRAAARWVVRYAAETDALIGEIMLVGSHSPLSREVVTSRRLVHSRSCSKRLGGANSRR